ncbi:hypothetical protein BASA83_007512 [Batrachochytrium salamandrivorans]|nr:hypothetical protein BASA83_007512 [Batrachochytrium salamandrivorans]
MASLYRSLILLLSVATIQVQGGKDDIKDNAQADGVKTVPPKKPSPYRVVPVDLSGVIQKYTTSKSKTVAASVDSGLDNEDELGAAMNQLFRSGSSTSVASSSDSDQSPPSSPALSSISKYTQITSLILSNKALESLNDDWVNLSHRLHLDPLPIIEVRRIFKKIVEVVLSLRNLGISHVAITAETVLYNPISDEIKLASLDKLKSLLDLENKKISLSKFFKSVSKTMNASPKPDPIDSEDVWYLGAYLFQILTSYGAPTSIYSIEALDRKIRTALEGNNPIQVKKVSSFICEMLSLDPTKRPHIDDLLSHAFFS